MKTQTMTKKKSRSRTVGNSESPYRTKPSGGKSAVGQAAASAAFQFRTISAMQDDGNSVQREAIDAAVLTAESAEAKRAKQRQKERYKKQYASPYYNKSRSAWNNKKSQTEQQENNRFKIRKKKKKSSISPTKSVRRFFIILIGSLLLVVLLFSITIFPILLPLTVLGEEEETGTTEITEEVSMDEQETFEVS